MTMMLMFTFIYEARAKFMMVNSADTLTIVIMAMRGFMPAAKELVVYMALVGEEGAAVLDVCGACRL